MSEREVSTERRDRRSDRVMAQLGEEIAAIASAAAMLSPDAPALARRMGSDLIRAQAWRASWLLHASATLWIMAFLGFAACYAGALTRPRVAQRQPGRAPA